MKKNLAAKLGSNLRRLGAAMLFSAMLAASAAGAHAEALVSPAWLNSHHAEPGLVMLDIRSAIDGSKPETFAQGHIPGSVHSDYDKAGWRVTRNNVPFMVPTTPELEKLIGDLGIESADHLKTTHYAPPAKRSKGVMVKDVAELVTALKTKGLL